MYTTDPLAGRGVSINVAVIGKGVETGFAERLIKASEEDVADPSEYQDFGDAHRQPRWFLDVACSPKRIHSPPGFLTPVEFEERWLRGQRVMVLQWPETGTHGLWRP